MSWKFNNELHVGVNKNQCLLEAPPLGPQGKIWKSGCLICFKWTLQNVFLHKTIFRFYVKFIYFVIGTNQIIFLEIVVLLTAFSIFGFNFELLMGPWGLKSSFHARFSHKLYPQVTEIRVHAKFIQSRQMQD